ncbi:MAG: 1-acyl-sn-glycerol-3-phosphate acyltransferase [Anaerolineales bacterium]|nr:1-acyl-sn-glycerol-3-phosphate acyltransferase [Anaerolineales bacterium]
MSEQPVYVPGRLSPANVDRARALLRWAFGIFADLEVRGREHLPAGGCLVCPNHLSRFDAPLVYCLLPGRPVTAFAADTYRAQPFFRLFIQQVDTIWVHRGAIGPSTLKYAWQALRAGRSLGLAPEGTRSLTGALQPGKPGAAALAAAAGAPIVPVAITNTEHLGAAMRSLRWLGRDRLRLTVTFGRPFTLPPIERHERAEKLDEYTAEIMCRIAALLPAHYHGVYAGHPRLAALLAEA